MTIVANTHLTFSGIGNREDLSDVIYDISSTDTPFTSGIGRSKASGVLHEWQTDSLAAAAANAQIEGNETTFSAVSPTSRVSNRCQILDKECIVSGTQEVVDKAGRRSEMVREMLKRSKEIKRDREFIMLNNQAPVTGNATTARQLRPANSWYTTNTDRGAGGADGSSSAAATDGTQRALTETLAKSVISAAWTAGGTPSIMAAYAVNNTIRQLMADLATWRDAVEAGTFFDANLDLSNVPTLTLPASAIASAAIADGAIVTSKILDVNVTTAKIADANVTTSKIADDAVTLAKMAGGTDGNLISFDTAGNPAYVATGTAAQVLTSNGAGAAPTMQTPAAGVATYTSSDTNWVAAALSTFAHGLGAVPSSVLILLVATSAVGGYSIGDETIVAAIADGNGVGQGFNILIDATNVKVRTADTGYLYGPRPDTGARYQHTAANFDFKIVAMA